MIFTVVIGGLGTIEGPIIGAVIFFSLQQLLADYGTWYLIFFGVIAAVVSVFARRGLWGAVCPPLAGRPVPGPPPALSRDGVSSGGGTGGVGGGGERVPRLAASYGSRAQNGSCSRTSHVRCSFRCR